MLAYCDYIADTIKVLLKADSRALEGVDGWTRDPVEVTGEDIEDVKESLLLMLQDIDKHGVKDYG